MIGWLVRWTATTALLTASPTGFPSSLTAAGREDIAPTASVPVAVGTGTVSDATPGGQWLGHMNVANDYSLDKANRMNKIKKLNKANRTSKITLTFNLEMQRVIGRLIYLSTKSNLRGMLFGQR